MSVILQILGWSRTVIMDQYRMLIYDKLNKLDSGNQLCKTNCQATRKQQTGLLKYIEVSNFGVGAKELHSNLSPGFRRLQMSFF